MNDAGPDRPMTLAAGAKASVRVPATSANLGPGFDALGLALALYDDVSVEVISAGLRIEATGEGAQTVPRDGSHLIVRAIRATLSRLGTDVPGLSLRCVNRIPQGRGLGSSAAAICAGVLLGRALVPGAGGRFDRADVLALAAEIEGHPDNVAACLLGGVTVAWSQGADPTTPGGGTTARARRIDPDRSVRAVVIIPPHESSTTHARGLLPATVSHVDAAFNAGRCALLVLGLSRDPSVLFAATADRLHQSYRAAAMPQSVALVDELRRSEAAAVLSGAGPSVLVLAASAAEANRALALSPPGWRAEEIAIDHVGATVLAGPD